jgi:CRP-like cAMP-binding protein
MIINRGCYLGGRERAIGTSMKNAFVRKMSGFAVLSAAEQETLANVCGKSRVLPARHDLIREGDKPGPVFVVLEGWACRYKLLPEGGRQIMAFLMPGDFCDMHIAILDEMDHNIGTISKARVALVHRHEMEAVIEATPAITQAFWRAQLIDEGTLRAWIVSMGRRGSAERVAHLLCELYVRAHNIGLALDERLQFPLTQIVLADALGLTPVHLNRVLRTFREDGIVEIGRGMLTIADPDKLSRIAGFHDNYLHKRLKSLAYDAV